MLSGRERINYHVRFVKHYPNKHWRTWLRGFMAGSGVLHQAEAERIDSLLRGVAERMGIAN